MVSGLISGEEYPVLTRRQDGSPARAAIYESMPGGKLAAARGSGGVFFAQGGIAASGLGWQLSIHLPSEFVESLLGGS
jgi:hypothetical protein